MRFAIKNGGDEQIVDASSKLQGSKWHHVAVTLGAGSATIWVDGQAVGSSSISIKPSDIRPVLNYIGRSQFVADPLFNGIIDDVRIYNYPLTAEELQGIIGNPTAVSPIEGNHKAPDAPIYDLQGRRVSQPQHGIFIKNGQKIAR